MTQGISDPSRIFVVGSGVVGAATGRGFRAAGHEVMFVDMPLLRAVVETNDRMECVVHSEADPAVA
jgi:2-polyprenyl-6-methoxyphenol hydroxylase-like FAD-dependent oxidoreductase